MEKEKDYTKWTRKEFESLPRPTSYTNDEIGEVDSLVILPTRHIHDSGYRCMEFVTIQNGKPTYIISGGSDVIHLGGIGGYNCRTMADTTFKYKDRMYGRNIALVDWSIDCLHTSGLLRLFCSKKMYVGASLSSFELYFKED